MKGRGAMNASYNPLAELKRKIYLAIIPLFFISNIVYYFVSPMNHFMEIVLPPTCLLLCAFWWLFYKRKFVYYTELFCVAFASFFQLSRVHTMVHALVIDEVNVYMFWSPIYYILVFMVLERKKALIVSLSMLLIVISISFPIAETVRAKDIMGQYYVTTFIYITIMFYFRQVITAYTESIILARNAFFDHLTGIGNRRSIDTWLEKQIERAEHTQQSFSIIYFDIDHFKSINDLFGHERGDEVLREVAHIVNSKIEADDLFGRWGGEEFVVVATNRSLADTLALAVTLRQTIEQHHFTNIHSLTASFGVTEYIEQDTAKSIIKRADEALYYAKNTGRNQVISSSFVSYVKEQTEKSL